MANDKLQFLTNMTPRQKLTAGAFILILIIVIWQMVGLLGEGEQSVSSTQATITPAAPPPQQITPQPAALPVQPKVMTQHEKELVQLQQQTEAKYLNTLNQLQMLKLEQEIVETNKAIADATLGMVTAQKNIVELLSPTAPKVSPGTYAQGLAGGTISAASSSTTPSPQVAPVVMSQQDQVMYAVVSISRLRSKWSAVLGYQTNLYHVSVGDVLPVDGSTVVSINRSGVVLEKDGIQRTLSLVPII